MISVQQVVAWWKRATPEEKFAFLEQQETYIPLWEVDHPYYCNEGNYFAPPGECSCHYRRWQDFVESEGDSDFDMNLLFRFDWVSPRKDGDPDEPIEWQGDENYRDCTLELFWMGQRKGLYRYTIIDVCRADEPKVREWLRERWEHMRTLWEPLANTEQSSE